MNNDDKQNGVIKPSDTTPVVGSVQNQVGATVATNTSTVNPTNTVNDQMIAPPVPKKKVNNKIIMLALIVLVIFGIGYYAMNNKNTPVLKNDSNVVDEKKDEEVIKLDTGTKWGDEYAIQLQNFFKNFDSVDIAFIDLDFNDVPEMIVKFSEDKKESLQVFYISEKTNSVTSSKAFANSEIKLIYSLYEGVSRFYLHIRTSDKYGTYTEAPRILQGTVYKTDIEAANDNQVNEFKTHYVVSDYDITYYEVKKESFEDNFKTMYERIDRYSSEISEKRDDLDKENKDKIEKKIDKNDSLSIADYKLVYGKYIPDETKITDGTIYDNIYLNNDGTIKIGNKVYRYEFSSNIITLENGTRIKVLGNDHFMTESDGGIVYYSENPINMTDDEIRTRESEERDAAEREKAKEEANKIQNRD